MNNIWEILNIEPTKDKAAIKRAYALLARKYNPEDEPEKYQELHEAYKQALFLADNTNVSIADPEEIKESEDLDEDGPFENNEEDDEENDDFDFSTVGQDYLPDNSLAEEVIEDIIAFRKANNLNSREDLKMLSHSMKESMSIRMFDMYKFLAFRTDDVTVWDSFFNEPLIKYCMDFQLFRDTVIQELEDNPSHLEAVKKIMSEFGEAPDSAHIIVEKKGFSMSHEKKIRGLIILIFAWLTQLILSLFSIVFFIDNPLIPTILMALVVMGFLALSLYTIIMFGNRKQI